MTFIDDTNDPQTPQETPAPIAGTGADTNKPTRPRFYKDPRPDSRDWWAHGFKDWLMREHGNLEHQLLCFGRDRARDYPLLAAIHGGTS